MLNDRYFIINDQEQITFIDTATFEPSPDQALPLDAPTETYDFLANSFSLFAYRKDGFIPRILANAFVLKQKFWKM